MTRIFSFHDKERDFYFWGDALTQVEHQRLFVQNAITGQRLPPAVSFGGKEDRAGRLMRSAMSRDCRHIAVLYDLGVGQNGYFELQQLTVIWHIEDRLDFQRRMYGESWAKIIYVDCVYAALYTDIVFGDDGYCFSPSGRIDLDSGISLGFSRDLLSSPERFITDAKDSLWSGTGEYLFIFENLQKRLLSNQKNCTVRINSFRSLLMGG